MFKKITTALLTVAIAISTSANAFAESTSVNKNERSATIARTTKGAESKKWLDTSQAAGEKPFDPASRKSTMAEYEKQKAAGKKLSTTTKVLIGVGIAVAVVAIVFVVAKDDLEDNILR